MDFGRSWDQRPVKTKKKSIARCRRGARIGWANHYWLHVPSALPLVIVKDPSPSKRERWRKIPRFSIVLEPQPKQMPLAPFMIIIEEGFPTMQQTDIVDESHVAFHCRKLHLLFLGNVVYSIKGICLSF